MGWVVFGGGFLSLGIWAIRDIGSPQASKRKAEMEPMLAVNQVKIVVQNQATVAGQNCTLYIKEINLGSMALPMVPTTLSGAFWSGGKREQCVCVCVTVVWQESPRARVTQMTHMPSLKSAKSKGDGRKGTGQKMSRHFATCHDNNLWQNDVLVINIVINITTMDNIFATVYNNLWHFLSCPLPPVPFWILPVEKALGYVKSRFIWALVCHLRVTEEKAFPS